MAGGPLEVASTSTPKPVSPWMEIFRCFQVALDPNKLLVAALGILVMSVGWYLLSTVFYYSKPKREDAVYSAATIQKESSDKQLDEAGLKAEGDRKYNRDFEQWKILHDLAGPAVAPAPATDKSPAVPGSVGGRLRTLPWDEYRGPNPFFLVTALVSGSSEERSFVISEFIKGTVPVLVEPLAKLLLPVVKLIDPNVSFQTRLYLLLCLLWNVAVWAFFGGVITRIAAVQLSGREKISLTQAVKFVIPRYRDYVLSPLVPLIVIAFIVIGLAVFGFVALIPLVGDVLLYGLLYPLILLGGVAMAVLIIGLIGYPLMYTTISTEGSDTFDALARSYNYVFQAPWAFFYYSFISVLYGALVTLFVVFVASLTVYISKWAVSQAPLSEYFNRKPDYLFIYAPESFGWKEFFLKGTDMQLKALPFKDPDTDRLIMRYEPANPKDAEKYRSAIWGVEKAGAALVTVWLTLGFLLMLGFSYSFFWTASTMIYLLMRKRVDDTELDEVFLEEDLPPLPPIQTPVSPPAPASPAVTTLPMTSSPPAPVSPPVSPPAPVSPPVSPPAPVSPPVSPPAPVSPPVSPPAPLSPPSEPTKPSAE
jgi:hypothetical protein